MGQTREELLSGLYEIKKEIEAVNALQGESARLRKMLKPHEQYLPTGRFHDITHHLYYTCVMAGLLAVTITDVIAISYTQGSFWTLLFPLLAGYALYKKRAAKKSILRSVVGKILIACNFFFILGASTFALWIVLALANLCVSFFIVKAYLKKSERDAISENKEIKGRNDAIDTYNSGIYGQMQGLREDIDLHVAWAAEAGGAWFPEAYYYLDAVDYFIKVVTNRQADSVKEMVSLYETKRAMDEQKNLIREVAEQNARAQEAIAWQMTFSNIMRMGELESLSNIEKKLDRIY